MDAADRAAKEALLAGRRARLQRLAFPLLTLPALVRFLSKRYANIGVPALGIVLVYVLWEVVGVWRLEAALRREGVPVDGTVETQQIRRKGIIIGVLVAIALLAIIAVAAIVFEH